LVRTQRIERCFTTLSAWTILPDWQMRIWSLGTCKVYGNANERLPA
jgi:hypothetical protein